MITQEDRDHFATEGYHIAKGVVDPEKAAALLENAFLLYQRFSPDSENWAEWPPWNTQEFHEQLLALRASSPKTFSVFYDSAQTSIVLGQLVSSPSIVDEAADLLGVRVSELSMEKPEFRMDAPRDDRNKAKWHQEQSYFGANKDGMRGLTVWLPLIDTVPELGPLDVCPGSHIEGFIGPGSTKWQSGLSPMKVEAPGGPSSRPEPDYMVTEQLEVSPGFIDKYETKSVPLKVGDALLFNMLVFHRSGTNISDQIRFSAQLRIHTATSDDFRPYVTVPKYNPYVDEISV